MAAFGSRNHDKNDRNGRKAERAKLAESGRSAFGEQSGKTDSDVGQVLRHFGSLETYEVGCGAPCWERT
jgi:hypothetical protein